jgi:hypothetical protein
MREWVGLRLSGRMKFSQRRVDRLWRIASLIAAIMLSLLGASAQAAPAPRQRQIVNLDPDWRFHLGDVAAGAAAPDFDDKDWSRVGLPHSFSIPYFQAKTFYVGYGWYRRHIRLEAPLGDLRYNLEFDGAFQDAEVFVNGRPVGHHLGGYTGFSLDISQAVHVGDNVIAVRLNNLWNPRLAPRAGEHTFSGGLYRDVRLVATPPLHVTWYGAFVTTPGVSARSSRVNIKTELRNDGDAAGGFTLVTDIVDPTGRRVARVASPETVAAHSTLTADQTTAAITRPKLWSPDHPALYRAIIRVQAQGRTIDTYQSTFGFRWFSWTADRGFFLNGKHLYLRGVNAHQDHAGWGDAVTDAGLRRDVGLIKAAGFNFVRGSHYPHAPAFADATDAAGLLFWSENDFWGTGALDSPWGASAYPPDPRDQPAFEDSVKASLADMIRINRNHPSIVAWSMDNEVFFSDDAVMPKVRALLSALVAETHALDPTRPAAIGGAQRGEIDKLGDIAGYNGDGAVLFLNPGVANIVTEYGSTSQDRPGAFAPGWGDLTRAPDPNASGKDAAKPYTWRFAWRSGEALWSAFDHGTIAGREFGSMGMIDYYRLPKRQYYWYRQAYAHIPPLAWPTAGKPAALRLTSDKAVIRADGTDDTQLIVTVLDATGRPISNSPPVTLSVVSGPGAFPTGHAIRFDPKGDIAIRDGQAAMEFRAYHRGQVVVEAASDGLRPARLTLQSVGGPPYDPATAPSEPTTLKAANTAPSASILAYGLNNPTLASSSLPGYAPNLANDGDPATEWRARPDDPGPWFILNLERIISLRSVRLTFPQAGAHAYVIEASVDGQTWRMVDDQSKSERTEATREDDLEPLTAEMIRVRLSRSAGELVGISEITVLGSP